MDGIMDFDEYFKNYSLSGGTGVMDGVSSSLGPESVQGIGRVADPRYKYRPDTVPTNPDIGSLAGPAPASGPPASMEEAASTMRSVGVNDSEFEPQSDGIGLMGTLGILNLGAGLGSQIYKMVTAEKPRRPRMPIPMPGGNPMR
jgi:hypothetical protein